LPGLVRHQSEVRRIRYPVVIRAPCNGHCSTTVVRTACRLPATLSYAPLSRGIRFAVAARNLLRDSVGRLISTLRARTSDEPAGAGALSTATEPPDKLAQGPPRTG